MGFIILIVIIVVLAGILIGLYNSIVQLKIRADSAWSDIDVQLKRRHDLIPNLVETVKGYAAHEKGTFENVAKWRSAAMSATAPAERAQAEGQLTMALKSLFAVAEAYPQLHANENFMSLQNSLTQIEDSVQNSRRYYNAVVRDYNTRIQTFPANMFAGMFGFTPRQFFELETPADREVPSVKF
jgi:LemA protein